MDAPQPGHFWKTPFIWEPGDPEPTATHSLRFAEPPAEWLTMAVGEVMSHSLDESDQYAITNVGRPRATAELLALVPQYFIRPDGWWSAAIDSAGHRVGFVLPVLFQEQARYKDGRPQGTILHMGVLPAYRGKGYGVALLMEATRILIQANCWRIFCDTATRNLPMVHAFRAAGYRERTPWQRPLA